ncbi:GIY-YIG nuclease family protein [Roseimaritima sediminicola]|uniref:GIY-YIG nuclease family protein n=1 Tax=Roseimaritima sediminicola TaxID=2662066 RepID=UPI00129840A7|nr:GIY-YIG nuclease family protein [Roseimaritima sediminicola]
MDAMWKPDEPRGGFGPDPFNPYPFARPLTRIGGHCKKQLRQEIQATCPKLPGVYGMLDRQGQLIYVGKSKQLRSRLLSYFSECNAEEKGGRIIAATRAIQWETQPSEFAALLREQHLIRTLAPRWNVQEIPKRQRPVYLCLGRAPAPYFFLTRLPPKDYVACEGPFHGAGRMGHAVDVLNKHFKLRDCSSQQAMHFADQLSLFQLDHRPGCLRLEIGSCLGPCAAACSRSQYDAQVAAAKSFLEGMNAEILDDLQSAMESAALRRQFELAARARDSLRVLERLHKKLLFLADVRRTYSFVYSVAGYDGSGIWYLIRNGEIADRLVAPKCKETFAQARPDLRRWAAELEGTGGPPTAGPASLYPHTLSLVARWFRKHKQAHQQTFLPSQAGRKYRSPTVNPRRYTIVG